MNIIYAANAYTTKAFKKYFSMGINLPGQAAAKYNRLLAEGLTMQDGVSVTMISEMPINIKNSNQKVIVRRIEVSKGVRYIYLPLINIHRVMDILSFVTAFLEAMRCAREKGSIVLSDILAVPVALGSYFAARIMRIPYVAIITDLPEYVYGKKDKAYKMTSQILIKKADKYVFLTEQMNNKVNNYGKPYVVIEGMTDVSQKSDAIRKVDNDIKKCLYTGNLNKKYGIDILIKGFVRAGIENTELHICGNGEMTEELRNNPDKYKNVYYHGCLFSDEVITMQKDATLLVNPRPSVPEYTKYSFPSKTTEYMSSGTPVLMTDLPGVPEEYKKHTYILKDETVIGMTKALKEVLSLSEAELTEKGYEAYIFVMREKNNRKQAQKALRLLR